MATTFGVTDGLFGTTKPTGSYVSEQSKDTTVEVAEVRDETGAVVVAVPHAMSTSNVSISGKGDAVAAISTLLAASGTWAAGTFKITSVKGTESNTDFPDFEISGMIYTNL